MSYKLSDVVHETANFWVLRNPLPGRFDVFKVMPGCHYSVKVGTFEFPSNPGYSQSRAIAFCDSRQNELNKVQP